ncbi:MAG: SufD family Fe-S cluster assembly protein [Candidatus Euphemobacter frigidus]|nr:SufD family Fe-S cluster assembly protein [Candidatus Euphemobacter frigidus]
MSNYEDMIGAYKEAGGDPGVFKNVQCASLVVNKNRVLGKRKIKGIKIFRAEELPRGVRIKLVTQRGYKIENPVYLCFGILPQRGTQEIYVDLNVSDGSSLTLIAHCTFPNAIKIKHIMNAEFRVGKGASLGYHETHYHGQKGGAEVLPRGRIYIEEGGRLETSFTLIKGKVGKLRIDYEARAKKKAIAELIARVYGKGDDDIRIREKAILDGPYAKSLIKTRVAVKNRAKTMAIGITEGNAPFCRGHVDCIEIVQGKAQAKALPIVQVNNDKARVTHEAAIGRIDQKQLETVMARGISQEEAIDVVVKGMLT